MVSPQNEAESDFNCKAKKWKLSEKDTDQVQIDGVTQSWNQFKQASEKEIKTKKI